MERKQEIALSFMVPVVLILGVTISAQIAATPESRSRAAKAGRPAYVMNFNEAVQVLGQPATLVKTGIKARRSNGDEVEIVTHNDGRGKFTHRSRTIRLEGAEISIPNEELKVFSAKRHSNRIDLNDPDPATGCLLSFYGDRQFVKIGDDSVLGFSAVKVRPANSGKAMGHEIWFLPSMNCLMVKRVTLFKDPATQVVTDTSEWTSVSIGSEEIGDELFQVASVYQRVAPSEAIKRHVAKISGRLTTLNPHELQALSEMDNEERDRPPDLGRMRR